MRLIKKLFHLPSPQDLGWGSALAMEDFNDDPDVKTWEDYQSLMKKDYPVRAFIHYTILDGWRYKVWHRFISRPSIHAIYWLKCHMMPSYRFHKLDLRQPKYLHGKENTDQYTHGWIDSDRQMIYAVFSILENFVQTEFTHFHCPPEDNQDGVAQRAAYFEILALHDYWTVERNDLQTERDATLSKWCEVRQEHDKDSADASFLWEKMGTLEKKITAREDEMLVRLLKIRGFLWT
jgi:hypothetical protein